MLRVPRMLASISFPSRLRALTGDEVRDLAKCLEEIGAAIRAGRHSDTSSIYIPFQERTTMNVEMHIVGSDNKPYWGFKMYYVNLSPQYAVEIAGPAKSFAAYIENTAGLAAGDDPAYKVSFDFEVDQQLMRGLPEPFAAVFKGKARCDNLRFSQAVNFQDAGLELLQQLNKGAHREIASGERK